LLYKRDWDSVSGHKVLLTLTYQERVRREKKAQRDRLGNSAFSYAMP